MCGIVGVFGPAAQKIDLSESLRALSLRGPDRQAEITSGQAHFGHTRLSIIDTSTMGNQPMQDPSGRYTLVFNGEIYNYRTIAKDLRGQGIEFKSHSDTEVVLNALINKGKKALNEFNGFFSLAFHDAKTDSVLLARDRIGIKPLYYSWNKEHLSFSSEMKGLMPLLSEKQLDHTAIQLYFRFNYIPTGCSVFKDVRQIGPGELIEFKDGKAQVEKYYEIGVSPDSGSSLKDLLEDAVKLRLVADVPLGSFLSGGVDSSIIAALAVKEKPDLKTFSIGFKDNQHFDESSYAELVAKHIGSNHKTIQLSDSEMLEHVEGLLQYIDEPFADSSAIAVHALCQHTRKEVTVALSGDGADELFGGYNKHQAHLAVLYPDLKERMAGLFAPMLSGFQGSHSSTSGNIVRQLKRFDAGRKLNASDRYWKWASWTDEVKVKKLLDISSDNRYEKILAELGPKSESIEEVLLADTRAVLPNDMLTKVDRMSMANSLEVRVPFLDHRVVDYAHSLSAAERMKRGQGKYILEDNFGHILPQEIFSRKKKGFEVPLESWFLGPLNSDIRTALSDDLLASSGLFVPAQLSLLLDAVKRKEIGDVVHLLWAVLVFYRFYTRYGH